MDCLAKCVTIPGITKVYQVLVHIFCESWRQQAGASRRRTLQETREVGYEILGLKNSPWHVKLNIRHNMLSIDDIHE